MSERQWYYVKGGMIEDETIGPIEERAFLQEVRAGHIRPKTKVMSPTRTKQAWHCIEQIPVFQKMREQGEAERAEQKRQQAEEKQRQRELEAQEKADRKRQQAEDGKQQHELAAKQKEEERKRQYGIDPLVAFLDSRETQPGPAGPAEQAPPPLMSMIQCRACRKSISASAATCPACGAPNDWLNPEIQRLVSSLQQQNFLPAESHVFWKGDRVWGTAMSKSGHTFHPANWALHLMVAGFALLLVGCFIGWDLIAPALITIGSLLMGGAALALFLSFLSGSAPATQVGFELDFSYTPPKWSCNDEQYWGAVRRFFNVYDGRSQKEEVSRRSQAEERRKVIVSSSRSMVWLMENWAFLLAIVVSTLTVVITLVIVCVVSFRSSSVPSDSARIALFYREGFERGDPIGQAAREFLSATSSKREEILKETYQDTSTKELFHNSTYAERQSYKKGFRDGWEKGISRR